MKSYQEIEKNLNDEDLMTGNLVMSGTTISEKNTIKDV